MFLRVMFFLAVITVLTLIYNVTGEDNERRFGTAPTKQLIQYKIGQVDPKFNISEEELKYLVFEATKIWEDAVDETLFEYNETANLSINLIYDERQKNALYVDELNQTMEKKSVELDQMNQRIENQLNALKARQTEMDRAAEQLRNEQMAWRRLEFEGGAELQRIKEQANDLKKKQQKLSGDFDGYHLNVQLYNQKVADYNRYAEQARTFNLNSPARLFHKGIFSGDRIDVYQFSSKNDLKVTLAHEFGHALGMSHHQDPKALMYPTMSEQDIDQFKLQPADLLLFQQR